ncbi:transglutaminase domain-containing protein [Flavobacterium ajazii]|uniref:transglutaminase domain-containing protein n=1 Tax=Flavobacterium ajazii TaxID=2692318 RepID=UPI0013D4DC53|nr:transglutaminase domain-containing protein [Flavobacterium ajazii]
MAQKKQKNNQKNYDLLDAKMDQMPIELNQSIDSIGSYINKNFATESEKIRAVFYWTAKTISYDVENMFEVKFDESLSDRIERTFITRKGVCFDYSNIFNVLAVKAGIKCFVIAGYTKSNRINIDNLPHSWNAARIDNKWYLFDSTWGSGYFVNQVFIRKINNNWFKIDPELMIMSHMPFDYLWQFLNNPINNQEFMEGVYSGEQKPMFDFEKEIVRYESIPKVQQLFEVSQRIEKGGLKNQHISQAFIHAKTAWKNEEQKEKGRKFNEIVTNSNEAVKQLNEFLRYKNRKFQPKLSDDEIKKKIQAPRDLLAQCNEALSEFDNEENSSNKENIENLKKSISNVLENADENVQFVNAYLAKPELARKEMFNKPFVRKPNTVK